MFHQLLHSFSSSDTQEEGADLPTSHQLLHFLSPDTQEPAHLNQQH